MAAAEADVQVEWVEGDAEALAFEDASFDVVVSTFGSMFAPRHRVAAQEHARVLRPGGRMGLCCWTPEGAIGAFFRTVGSHAPPPPPEFESPLLWGTEDHVGDLFTGTGVELSFRREHVRFEYESVEETVELFATKFGPVVKSRELLEAEHGDWSGLRDDLAGLFASWNERSDGTVAYDAEYLVIGGRKTG